MTTTDVMPVAFLGHGNPMNALERNRFTEAWRSFGATLPRPRAVLVVSAHWFVGATAVTAMARPRTIHDFYGFPDELFAVQYPAPGAPEVAGEVVEVVKPTWVGLDHDSWGLDHGTWSVLTHVLPQADVPVLQLSIDATRPLEHHVELGTRLAALRHRGVAIVASGNVVHNLRRVDWSRSDGGEAWAERYDEAARELMTGDPEAILRLADHPDHRSAVPTTDHFIPLLYVAAAAAAAGTPADVLVDGCVMGSVSMTSYTVGAAPAPVPDGPPPSDLPDPSQVPPEATNT